MSGNTDSDDLRQACSGDEGALGRVLARHRARLRLMVELRLDRRLHQRVDPSDVMQEAYLEAATRFQEFVAARDRMPFFLWLRLITMQRLLMTHRQHLGAQMRDAGREVHLPVEDYLEANSEEIAVRLIDREVPPDKAAVRAERLRHLQEAFNHMDPIDREVLVLRHFEQLSNAETAAVLGIQEGAASQRHVRALKRLKDTLTRLWGTDVLT